jgi:uncharacterized coiled-coil protein SlyX
MTEVNLDMIYRILQNLQQRMTGVEDRLGRIERRMTSMEIRLTSIDSNMANLHGDVVEINRAIDSQDQRTRRIEHRFELIDE